MPILSLFAHLSRFPSRDSIPYYYIVYCTLSISNPIVPTSLSSILSASLASLSYSPISLPKRIRNPLRTTRKNGRSSRQPPTSRSQQRHQHRPDNPRIPSFPNLQPQVRRPHPRHSHPTPLAPPHLHPRLHALIQTKAEEDPVEDAGVGNRDEEAGARERDVERRGELWRVPRRDESGG